MNLLGNNAAGPRASATPWGSRLGGIAARLSPGAGDFLQWWGRALASWLPPRWRRVLGGDRGRLLVQVEGGEMQLHLQQPGELQGLGRLPLLPPRLEGMAAIDPLRSLLDARTAELPRWLLLASTDGLRRRISLPAAAAERLRDVVGFEIDRQTPFTVDAVAYDARVLGRRESEGQIDVELVAVPRQVLEPQLSMLGALAPTLVGVDLAGADGLPLGVNLLPPAQRRHQRDRWAGWNLLLAGVAVVAVAGLLWQLLDNRREAADRLEGIIASQAEAGRHAAAQRQRLMNLIEGQAFLDRARAQQPTTIEVLDELSRRLPDGTYLEKLTIDDQQLLLIGLSREAAALVGQLQDTGLWQSPALAGALQPDPSSGRDRFTLVAEWASANESATESATESNRTDTSATSPEPDEAGDDATDPAR